MGPKNTFFGYGNGVFLAVSGTNYSTSSDGASWSVGSLPFVSYNGGPGVGFDGKRFIGTFLSPKTAATYVAISTNAVDWVPIKGPERFYTMSGANGLAILKIFNGISNSFSISTNGIDWTSKPFLNNPGNVIFDGKRYVWASEPFLLKYAWQSLFPTMVLVGRFQPTLPSLPRNRLRLPTVPECIWLQ